MHRLARHLFTFALAALAAGCYRAPELSGTDQVYDPNVEATIAKDNGLASLEWDEVDDYMDALIGDPNGPGCAVGIARGGSLTYLQGYGKAEIGGEDWDVGTMGAVGSVSKTFTAAAALRMHELGMIDVNQTVDAYLATTNGAVGDLRIYDLLAHSSGIGGATQNSAFSPDWSPGSNAAACVNNMDPACGLVSQSIAQPSIGFLQYADNEVVAPLAEGNPGAGMPDQGVYSNVGYTVLGAVIDSQSAYEAWVWDHIGQYTGDVLDSGNLLSLALSHSWRDGDMPHRAVGYVPNGGGGFGVLEAFDPDAVAGLEGWQGPAGGWAMTIGDLTRFALALNQQQIVGNAMLAAMRYDWTDLDGFANDYGFGTFLGDAGQPPYWHGGIIGGHTAVWSYWPASGAQPAVAMAMICNRSDITPFSLRDHTTALRAAIQGTSPSLPPQIAPVQVGNVNGRQVAFDPGSGWQSAPADTFLPLSRLSAPIELTVKQSRSSASVVLEQGGDHLATVAATFRDPWIATRPATVHVRTAVGSIPVHDFAVRGAMTTKGMTRVALSGSIDAREASDVVAMSADELCRTAGGGSRCQPCDDGARYCVNVGYEGLTASNE